jgi:pyruvate-formate lyase-activating enzyme
MANVGLPPLDWGSDAFGDFLTVVIPSGGCNLKCAFCLIDQRGEIASDVLPVGAFRKYISQVNASRRVIALAIQGHEPFLPAALPYTRAILEEAVGCGIPVSVVTNGTRLSEAITELGSLLPQHIGVSLDSADATTHNRIRGEGAWEATVNGLSTCADKLQEAGTALSVISVLLPRRRAYLDGVPSLLRRLGLRTWIVNAHLRLADLTQLPTHLRPELRDDLRRLGGIARQHDVSLIVDDELELLRPELARLNAGLLDLPYIRGLPPAVTLSRLSPSGHLAFGRGAVAPLNPATPRWHHESDAAVFFSSLRSLCARDETFPSPFQDREFSK